MHLNVWPRCERLLCERLAVESQTEPTACKGKCCMHDGTEHSCMHDGTEPWAMSPSDTFRALVAID